MTPREVLKAVWGYDSFRSRQAEIVESVLDGHDTLGLLPTGGGKSITFQVPALMLPGITIVVTPLISLMKDQVDNLMARGIRAVYLQSGMMRREVTLACDRLRLGKARLLYVSPERLRSESFISEVRSWNVSLIVVDEAHCISQWGYDFRPSYLRVGQLREVAGRDVPVLALTASATPAVRDDIVSRLGFGSDARVFAHSFARDNISYIVRNTHDKYGKMMDVLNNTAGSSIVYVRSRARTREIADMLNAAGIKAEYYHAGLDPHDKAAKQEAWKDSQVRVMVATNAFGMGIDKPDVRVVIHLEPPPSLEEYYQEAGRAGRDGLPSFAVLICSEHDKGMLTRRLNESYPPVDYVRRVYELAGNFMQVPVGEGYNHVYEFDIERFCKVFSLAPAPVRGSMALLTQAGYLDYMDDLPSRSRVMMLCSRNELYALNFSAAEEGLVLAMMREYTGLFSEYVYISEQRLSVLTGLSADIIYEIFLALTRRKVLHYIPRKAIPYVLYTTSREEPRYIQFGTAVYADRRAQMAARLEAVRTFAYSATQCRAQTILSYFGETSPTPCGHCDVCRNARREARLADTVDAGRVMSAFGSAPGAQSMQLDELSRLLSVKPEPLIQTLRLLAEEGRITITGTTITVNE